MVGFWESDGVAGGVGGDALYIYMDRGVVEAHFEAFRVKGRLGYGWHRGGSAAKRMPVTGANL